jgi:hypothetical protein
MSVFWIVAPCSLVEVYRCFRGTCSALMMEAASTSETFVNFYQTTRRYSPEDCHLHSRRREHLKSYNCRYVIRSDVALKSISYKMLWKCCVTFKKEARAEMQMVELCIIPVGMNRSFHEGQNYLKQ